MLQVARRGYAELLRTLIRPSSRRRESLHWARPRAMISRVVEPLRVVIAGYKKVQRIAPSRRVLTQRGAAGSIVKGLPLRRGAVCYCELPRVPLFPRTPVNRVRMAASKRAWLDGNAGLNPGRRAPAASSRPPRRSPGPRCARLPGAATGPPKGSGAPATRCASWARPDHGIRARKGPER
jgi:hypothetical protein